MSTPTPRLLLVIAAALAALLLTSAPADADTVVTLSFDDATADQMTAATILTSAGLPATFFVMAPSIGEPGHLSAADLRTLLAAGNEIGGHTLDHADLPTLSPGAQRHELCDDRQALLAMGVPANVVAYPFGHFDASSEAIAQSCGYAAARQSGGLAAPGGCSGACPVTESIPPADPFAIRSAASITSTVGLGDLQQMVMAAEATGGWLTLTFHHICAGCSTYSTDPAVLSAFATWLAARAPQGTVVRTMSQALASGPLTPAPPPPPAESAPPAAVPPPALAPAPHPRPRRRHRSSRRPRRVTARGVGYRHTHGRRQRTA